MPIVAHRGVLWGSFPSCSAEPTLASGGRPAARTNFHLVEIGSCRARPDLERGIKPRGAAGYSALEQRAEIIEPPALTRVWISDRNEFTDRRGVGPVDLKRMYV